MHLVLTGTLLFACLLGQDAQKQVVEKRATDVISIQQGKLRGIVEGDDHVFRGIPYAASTAGENRWRAPQPPTAWEGVRDCVDFGPACPQNHAPLLRMMPLSAIKSFGEDCLNLNIYRPKKPSNEKLPVMVWIHGGAYIEGSANMGIYNGASLAKQGAVVVTINYRMGPFGFLAHPALTAEEGTSGNYGLLDQIEALRWVKNNISAFGGDPDRVTVFGESAGAGSTVCLLVSPLAKGLFHRAIIQSCPDMAIRHLKEPAFGKPSAETSGEEFVSRCGLSQGADIAAMRKLSVETLLKVSPAAPGPGGKVSLVTLQLPVEPCVDGVVIPEDPNKRLTEGKFHRVPIIVGCTRDEAALFLLFANLPTEKDVVETIFRQEFGEHADRFLSSYPVANEAKVIRNQIGHLLTDLVFGAQSRFIARAASTGSKTYRYLFSRGSRIPFLAPMGAHHGCEVPYIFRADDPVWNWQAWDRELADMTKRCWVNFAATGDPNGQGLPTWPVYDGATEQTLELGDKITVLQKYRHAPHDTVDEYVKHRR